MTNQTPGNFPAFGTSGSMWSNPFCSASQLLPLPPALFFWPGQPLSWTRGLGRGNPSSKKMSSSVYPTFAERQEKIYTWARILWAGKSREAVTKLDQVGGHGSVSQHIWACSVIDTGVLEVNQTLALLLRRMLPGGKETLETVEIWTGSVREHFIK